ncbi:uncharacterized protein [Diabrotica undecimpunctata]
MEDILDIEMFGESDFEDDDMDDAVLLHVFGNNLLGNRADLYGRFSLETLSDLEVKNLFRFEKVHIPRLALALGILENITTEENITLPGINALCILLRRFTYPNRLSDLEPLFGYSFKAVSSIANKTMDIIIQNKGYLIENLGNVPWLNENKLNQYSQAIAQKGAPIDNCWGFIDGTVRPICRPVENQREYYSGYKKIHCVKYQSLICPDGIIINLKGAYPGRKHDSGILRESGLYNELEQFSVFDNRNYVIYGDKGYSLRELLLQSYTENEVVGNPARQQFNTEMSRLRIAVEWGFNKIIQEFAFLDFKKNQKILKQEIGKMYRTVL